ncbi:MULTISPECIES: hypothetical protein [Hafnia]|uniref:hypothetical protein n=1 Tax=Hafnia TaxID=568 RepID=UPI0010336D05|nr:hypothetical protein [Hafnia alvei]MCV9376614.1 hypothetical protein [Hafnia alvei]MDX6846012.1 hypothetical protein [Hafnia alvei]TBM24285.1 hypothetical protein EYY91_18305 [Hafnia alvei]WQD25969.1 hypothetical protein U0008_03290 [Hafnia alvei]
MTTKQRAGEFSLGFILHSRMHSSTHGVSDVFCSYTYISPAFCPVLSFVVTPKIPACGLLSADVAAIVNNRAVNNSIICHDSAQGVRHV